MYNARVKAVEKEEDVTLSPKKKKISWKWVWEPLPLKYAKSK